MFLGLVVALNFMLTLRSFILLDFDDGILLQVLLS